MSGLKANCLRIGVKHEPHEWRGLTESYHCDGEAYRPRTRYGYGSVEDAEARDETTATPTVGRIVHYVSHGTPVREDGSQEYESECRAAIITAVSRDISELVRLCVLSPEGMFFTTFLEYEPLHVGGSWHWGVH